MSNIVSGIDTSKVSCINKPDLNPLVAEMIYEAIPAESKDAITTRDLASQFGIDDKKLRRYIHHLRCEGRFVSSNNRGYFIGTKEEQNECSKRIWLHAMAELEAVTCFGSFSSPRTITSYN